MLLNCFEESTIKNKALPSEWRAQTSLDELADFLQFNWEQRSAFYDDGEVTSRQQFLEFTGQQGIKTKNYIGTIVFKGQQINIFPKIFREDKDDTDTSELSLKHLMKNLVRWLEYCTKIAYPYISISSDLDDANDLRELFITLYIRYVKNAIDRGLFYRYEEQTEDCSSIKGKIDLKDYFTRKIPNGIPNKFSCTFSSFVFDNALNRIIKYTCKSLMNETSAANQKIIRHILMKLNDVADVKCTPADCNQLRLSHLHKNYSVILSMSKMFLLNKTTTYSVDDTESFCFLFPTEVLFEGFIGGFLQSVLGDNGRVRLQASEQALIDNMVYEGESYGRAFTMRHDIFAEYQGKAFVLDTKYKQVRRFKDNPELKQSIISDVNQSDLYQISAYAAKRGLSDGYLLYPMYRFEDEEPSAPELQQKVIVDGVSHIVTIHLVRLPFVFEEDTERTRQMLTSSLQSIFQ